MTWQSGSYRLESLSGSAEAIFGLLLLKFERLSSFKKEFYVEQPCYRNWAINRLVAVVGYLNMAFPFIRDLTEQ